MNDPENPPINQNRLRLLPNPVGGKVPETAPHFFGGIVGDEVILKDVGRDVLSGGYC